jgi:hypothetical protein
MDTGTAGPTCSIALAAGHQWALAMLAATIVARSTIPDVVELLEKAANGDVGKVP